MEFARANQKGITNSDAASSLGLNNGVFDAYDIASGKKIYLQRLPLIGSGYSASRVAADGSIYLSKMARCSSSRRAGRNVDGHAGAVGSASCMSAARERWFAISKNSSEKTSYWFGGRSRTNGLKRTSRRSSAVWPWRISIVVAAARARSIRSASFVSRYGSTSIATAR